MISRTISVVRMLRSFGPLPRRRRIPQQRQPDHIRNGYFRALAPFTRTALREFGKVRDEILALVRAQRQAEQRMDDEQERKKLALELVARAQRNTSTIFGGMSEVERVATEFGKRTSEFQKGQLDQQVRAAFGVPLSLIEKPIAEKLPLFAAENAALIKTVPERYFDRISEAVRQAFETGELVDTLQEDFDRIGDASDNDTMRIAVDQVGKLNAQFNQERQEAMGVEQYTWRGMLDSRERDEHVALEGQVFSWDDPPPDGHPGEAVCCRCYAEPVLQPLIDAVLN